MQHLIQDSSFLRRLYYDVRKAYSPHQVRLIGSDHTVKYLKRHSVYNAHPAISYATLVTTGRYQLDEIIDTLDAVLRRDKLDSVTTAEISALLDELRRANSIIDNVIVRMHPKKRHYPPYLDPTKLKYW